MNLKSTLLLSLLFCLLLPVNAQKKSLTYYSLIEEVNASSDSANKKMRGISVNGGDEGAVQKFNKNYKGSFDRFAKEDISHIITGNNKSDIFNNNVSLDVFQPTLCLGFSYWLGKTEPNYKTIFNKANCEMMQVEKKKFPDLPFRMAASVELTAGTENNISTLFTSKGNALNSDLQIKPSLTFVFQGKYRLPTPDCFTKLKKDIQDKQGTINDAIALSVYLQSKIQKQIDSIDEASEKNMTKAKIARDSDLALELKAGKRKLNADLQEEANIEADLRSGLTEQVDDIIYNFPYTHRTYFWFSINGDWAWHNYTRYNPGDSVTPAYFDNKQFMTYNFGPSLNLFHAGMPGSWLTGLYLGTKIRIGRANNAINTSSNSYTTHTQEQINDSTFTSSEQTAEAYHADDFREFWTLNWNTSFIWYVDPMHIFGVNVFADFNTALTGSNKKGFWSIGQGLVFAIPSMKDEERSVTNFTLFVQEVDVQKSSVTATESSITKQHWYDRIDIGIKVGVPFGVFGRK